MTREHVMGKGLATLASHCNFNFNFNFMLFCLRCREKMEGKAPRYVKPIFSESELTFTFLRCPLYGEGKDSGKRNRRKECRNEGWKERKELGLPQTRNKFPRLRLLARTICTRKRS